MKYSKETLERSRRSSEIASEMAEVGRVASDQDVALYLASLMSLVSSSLETLMEMEEISPEAGELREGFIEALTKIIEGAKK